MDLTFKTSTQPATVSYCGFSRPYTDADDTALAATAIQARSRPDEIMELGRRLFRWLNGPAHWLRDRPRELVVEAPIDSPAWQAPWEIMADDDGHLAARGLSVVRRTSNAPALAALQDETDDYRLGVLFMAAAPEGGVPLRFEDEEAAILRAVREPGVVTRHADPTSMPPTELDLFGEDSGNLSELVRRLDVLQDLRIDVLHLSGHAKAGTLPVFVMETPEGECDEVKTERLVEALRSHFRNLPLIFLSACETGRLSVAESMAGELIREGAQAVLAWADSVYDDDATAFAAWLYHHLGRGRELSTAVAEARRELCRSGRPHWHLARLFVGRAIPGRLAMPRGKARSVNKARDPYSLAHVSGRPRPVCAEAAFVGRRRVIQRALRTLRSRQGCGIVLTGIGQQGKSSLAVRLGDRLRDRLPMVLTYGKLDAHRLHAQLAQHFGEPLDPQRPLEHAGAEQRLRTALEGWLRNDDRPMLLVLDDFEQNLDQEATPVGPLGEVWPVVTAVLGAFVACPGVRSKLVITSRVAFECMDAMGASLHAALEVISLPEMDEQERSRMRTSTAVAWQLRRRAESSGRGNPGVTEALLRLAAEDPESFDSTCDLLDTATAPEGKIGEVLSNIALDALLASARRSPDADLLLRIGLFLDFPVPAAVFDQVAVALGVDQPQQARERLIALGLFEERGRDRLALNSLAATQLDPVSDSERDALGRHVLAALRTQPIEEDAGLMTQAFLVAAPAKELEMLAKTVDRAIPLLPSLDDPQRTTALAVDACRQLIENGHSVRALTIMHAVDQESTRDGLTDDLLAAARQRTDPADVPTIASLLLLEGRALARRGKPAEALERLKQAESYFERLGDARSRAVTLGDIAGILVSKGEVDEALALHQEELAVYERLGEARSRAVTLGDIARILVNKGEVDETLALHQERLAVFERLGDARSRAVTLGDIARILVSKGEVDEALALHREMLAVFERLGDARSRALTLGDIARILVSKGEVDEALVLHQERLAVFERLGDARSRAVTLGYIARILVSKGEVDEALALHQEILAVFERLGDARERALTLGYIARIRVSKGEVDEALALHQESLAVFERLGDARSRALTLGDIAGILVNKGEVDEALALYQERLAVFERLGDARSRAVTLGDIAGILVNKGEVDEALALHQERLAVFERLGDARERAVTLGDIARILVNKGEVDETLALHQERLAVFERLGDARERAVTLGDIAGILVSKGEVDEALRLNEEKLLVNRRLGDADGIATAQWDLAQLDLARRDLSSAMKRLDEAWPILNQIGRVDGLAVIGSTYGQLLAMAGENNRAREVLAVAIQCCRKLGRINETVKVEAILERLDKPASS